MGCISCCTKGASVVTCGVHQLFRVGCLSCCHVRPRMCWPYHALSLMPVPSREASSCGRHLFFPSLWSPSFAQVLCACVFHEVSASTPTVACLRHLTQVTDRMASLRPSLPFLCQPQICPLSCICQHLRKRLGSMLTWMGALAVVHTLL